MPAASSPAEAAAAGAGFSREEIFETASPEETLALGERLAAALVPGSVVALRGPLGAGKTCLTKGIGRGLGLPEEEITSPTYTIVTEHELPGGGALLHIDAYRLQGEEDFAAIGGEELLEGGIVVIEWSERVEAALPAGALRVDLAILEDGRRRLRVTGGGAVGA